MLTFRLVSIEEAYQLATRIEQQLRSFTPRPNTASNWNIAANKGSQPFNKVPSTFIPNKSTMKSSSISGRTQQNRDERGKLVVGPRSKKGKEECYCCGGRGHFAIVCPTREHKHVFLCNEEGETTTSGHQLETQGEIDAEVSEEQLDGSNLPLCVIKRILTGQKTVENDEEEWLQTNIFHTRVEHQGKALNLMIDNGSDMNVISHEAVEKMKFPTEKHPKPYKVSWVDDTSIPIKTRYLVFFFIRTTIQR